MVAYGFPQILNGVYILSLFCKDFQRILCSFFQRDIEKFSGNSIKGYLFMITLNRGRKTNEKVVLEYAIWHWNIHTQFFIGIKGSVESSVFISRKRNAVKCSLLYKSRWEEILKQKTFFVYT